MVGSGTGRACCQQQGCAVGSKCQLWRAQGTEPAWRAQHRHPLATDPPVPQFLHQQIGWSAVSWVVQVRKEMLRAAGKDQGGWRRFLCVCVKPGGLCLRDGQGEGSIFPGRG